MTTVPKGSGDDHGDRGASPLRALVNRVFAHRPGVVAIALAVVAAATVIVVAALVAPYLGGLMTLLTVLGVLGLAEGRRRGSGKDGAA